jgi:hypothetical protein
LDDLGLKCLYQEGNVKRHVFVSLLIGVLALSLVRAPLAAAAPAPNKLTAAAYQDTWRELWEDHIVWTRMVILGVLDDVKDVNLATARLLQNPADFEAALKLVLGPDNMDAVTLADLVTQHLVQAKGILEVIKVNGDPTTLLQAWYANGDAIAMQMYSMNPNFWPLDMGKAMWKAHLDATVQEVLARHPLAAGALPDYAADIAAYDLIHQLALGMADFFSEGLIKQFPQKFTGNRAMRR